MWKSFSPSLFPSELNFLQSNHSSRPQHRLKQLNAKEGNSVHKASSVHIFFLAQFGNILAMRFPQLWYTFHYCCTKQTPSFLAPSLGYTLFFFFLCQVEFSICYNVSLFIGHLNCLNQLYQNSYCLFRALVKKQHRFLVVFP